ncbi:sulfatase-like hydrolase/transferase, partial [Akkermansiaceae bacterium]|nr:sulfatase-like hydrolase/transferase [Akkermansiaceae bacterium]
DEIFKESMKFIRKNKEKPFFCYLPWTPPHGLWGIDQDDPSWKLFKDKPWTAGQRTKNDAKVYAAFMHMIDRQIGEIIASLKEMDLDQETIFFLCGDNGGQAYFSTKGRPHGFFGPNLNPETGERFKAGKGSLYEGGLKIPFLVRWPGMIKESVEADHLCYFPDIMPTLAELAGATSPKTDGLSLMPTLMGEPGQKNHEYLYWEYVGQTAVRMKNWKAYKGKKGDWQLYDLSKEVEEKENLAKEHPEVLKKLVGFAEAAHEPIRPGEIYDRELIDKDRLQAPHSRNKKKK